MTSIKDRLHASRFYPAFLRILRVLQFLSALVSIILFSLRVQKLINLYHQINQATGAVEGILAAAVLYTVLTSVLTLILKGRGGSFLRWLLVFMDILFIGAFIAVAILTSPDNTSAGLGCYGNRKRVAAANDYQNDPLCQLPLGTFITAIISTLLHALTAVFHEVRDHRRAHKQNKVEHDGALNSNTY